MSGSHLHESSQYEDNKRCWQCWHQHCKNSLCKPSRDERDARFYQLEFRKGSCCLIIRSRDEKWSFNPNPNFFGLGNPNHYCWLQRLSNTFYLKTHAINYMVWTSHSHAIFVWGESDNVTYLMVNNIKMGWVVGGWVLVNLLICENPVILYFTLASWQWPKFFWEFFASLIQYSILNRRKEKFQIICKFCLSLFRLNNGEEKLFKDNFHLLKSVKPLAQTIS